MGRFDLFAKPSRGRRLFARSEQVVAADSTSRIDANAVAADRDGGRLRVESGRTSGKKRKVCLGSKTGPTECFDSRAETRQRPSSTPRGGPPRQGLLADLNERIRRKRERTPLIAHEVTLMIDVAALRKTRRLG
jgi:hypothetical protein